ncbi:hypothetical protein [Nonomuraea composti]|uniref:hypothetical protein n=1 Tax=Nonomuraea composti TaxID=2720023 RepID=UPI0019813431|nr:hypothetical protein [Nonomuraea sp. FMUSA5-5]
MPAVHLVAGAARGRRDAFAEHPSRGERNTVPESDHLVQRRTMTVLVVAQIVGTVGVGGAPSIGILLAGAITDNEAWAGLARTASTLGAALLGLPLGTLGSVPGPNDPRAARAAGTRHAAGPHPAGARRAAHQPAGPGGGDRDPSR